MVQRLTPAFGGGNRYVQVVLNPGLPDEVTKRAGPQAGIERLVLSTRFT